MLSVKFCNNHCQKSKWKNNSLYKWLGLVYSGIPKYSKVMLLKIIQSI